MLFDEQLEAAYTALTDMKLTPRGFGFWDIADEGKTSQQRPNEPVWLAQGLNAFMNIR
jgi:hypothetical protein